MSRTKRLNNKTLQEDRDAYAALQAIEGYNPSNQAFKLADVTASHQSMTTKQTDEVQKQAAADASRDMAADGEWDFHNMILGVKTQVKAQFGENSDEYASLGMKKKSERRTGKRKAPSDGGTT